jgi:chromosome segregation ATPase
MIATKLSILAASKLYVMSRETIYKHLKNGDLSKDANGKIDLSEMIRVFGEPKEKTIKVAKSTMKTLPKDNESNQDRLFSLTIEKEQLKLQLKQLQEQVDRGIVRENWLQQQINDLMQRRIEHNPVKRSFLGRLLG